MYAAAASPTGATMDSLWAMLDEGRFAEAETGARTLLPRVEAESGLVSPEVADLLEILVQAMARGGNAAQPEALAAGQRAVAIREAVVGPEHADTARSLNVLTMVFVRRRELETARTLYQRVIAIREKALGPDHPETAEALDNLAVVEADLGNLFAARDMHSRALSILESAPGYEERELIGTLNNLATVYEEMGDFEAARATYERALDVAERTLGPEHPYTANVLCNFGIEPEIAGGLDQSVAMLKRALEIREKKLGPDHFLTAASLLNLANAVARKGEYAAAIPLYQRALRIAEAKVGADHTLTATILDGLGEALWHLGEIEAARSALERSVRVFELRLGPHHTKTAISRVNLARLGFAGGESQRSLDEGLAIASHVQATLEQVAQVASEREALRYGAVQASGLDLALSVLSEESPGKAVPPADIRRVWEALLRSRALVLDEMATRNRERHESTSAELAPLIKSLDEARRTLARLLARGPEPDRLDAFKAAVEESLAGAERAERAVIQKSGNRLHAAGLNAALDDVLRPLPAGSALLAFARYERSRRGDPRTDPAYVALGFPSGGKQPFAVPLGPADRIDALVARWRKEAGRPPSGPEAVAGYREAGSELRQAIWDPVKGRLGDPRFIFIVPDGDLNLVSFGALPQGPDRYLLESAPRIHYVSTERDLLSEPAAPRERRGLLLLGGADYDRVPAALAEERPVAVASVSSPVASQRGDLGPCDPLRRLSFAALPSSKDEVEEVRAMWARGPSGPNHMDPILLLSGAQAAEGEFKRKAPGRRIVHLATHGFWMSDLCASEAAGRAAPQPAGGVEPQPRPQTKLPLLVAGLALAGANRRHDVPAPADGEDGILTAEEIASLDLRGVEWVVLSACGTAVGPVLRGEGVFGLRRAFQVAGAETLILSLWPVGDHDTREWMRELYEARLSGEATVEAMRRASMEILAARRKAGVTTHPYFWGAFLAVGNWK